ncbi:type III secretion protein [Burkholderia cepacia]|uniref:Type III secretion protein n=1 Tax=Burkholderia cepacia TaxID=292 RepID=A0A2S8I0U2_BURCE|nr:EscU/YscU/HrcU family type III secretion system export apparatus switch protein [Burkholderia cepacia]PQP08288.1 type III secretion protein [Burkholderia cepacia]HDR9511859.1 EscU/YscU/HrcU family type III secretion system export apparatus switch protein [Burkholderia cepacia]
MSEKTEQPTDSRLRQARIDGQISKSRDLTQALTGVVWTLALSAMFYAVMGAAARLMQSVLDRIGEQGGLEADRIGPMVAWIISPTFLLCVGVALLGAIVAILFEFLQTRGLVSMTPVTPNFSKLNPLSQIKNIFSMRTLVELAKNLVKVTAISTCTLVVIRLGLPDLFGLARINIPGILVITTGMIFKIVFTSASVMLVLAVIDVLYQKYEYMKNLKMSKDEVKRDYKQQEGDPHVKGERRRLHSELADQ